jgi:hypothetical protein
VLAETSQEIKKLKKDVRTVDSSEEADEYFCIECAKPYSMSRVLTKWFQCSTSNKSATPVAPDSVTGMFILTATLMTTLMISRLKIDVML